LLGCESMEQSLPKEESMPVLSALAMLFCYFPFTQYTALHRPSRETCDCLSQK
jgi:hypothetical protein